MRKEFSEPMRIYKNQGNVSVDQGLASYLVTHPNKMCDPSISVDKIVWVYVWMTRLLRTSNLPRLERKRK